LSDPSPIFRAGGATASCSRRPRRGRNISGAALAGRNWLAASCGVTDTKFSTATSKERSGGEIDVVCRDQDTLVFVEVKTRTREDFGRPIAAVDRQKQKRISRGGLNWLRMLDNPDILFRFDVVEVIIAEDARPRLELIKNAFPLSKPYIY
jgi:putative endonuclease